MLKKVLVLFIILGCFDDGTEINNFESDSSNDYYYGI